MGRLLLLFVSRTPQNFIMQYKNLRIIHNINECAVLQDIGQYVYEVDGDGLYLLILEIKSSAEFNATVDIEMLGRNGYLSAVDWPLLPVS